MQMQVEPVLLRSYIPYKVRPPAHVRKVAHHLIPHFHLIILNNIQDTNKLQIIYYIQTEKHAGKLEITIKSIWSRNNAKRDSCTTALCLMPLRRASTTALSQ